MKPALIALVLLCGFCGCANPDYQSGKAGASQARAAMPQIQQGIAAAKAQLAKDGKAAQ